MKPRAIIVKTTSYHLFQQLVHELAHHASIRFFEHQINGEKTVVLKCFNYYEHNRPENPQFFYGNYTYLYTYLSLILTDFILPQYEMIFIHRILRYNYFYYGKEKIQQLANVLQFILNPHSPLNYHEELLLYRKQLILSALLQHFHHTNALHLDGFINFRLSHYCEFLEEIVFRTIQLSISNTISIEKLNGILKNMFDY